MTTPMTTPPRLLIDLATRCNLRCPMCSVWGDEEIAKGVKGVMPDKLIHAILEEVAGSGAMAQTSLWGEPLVAPHWRDSFRWMADAGLAIALNTNGLRLHGDNCRWLCDLPVASVFVSLDALKPETYTKTRGIDALRKVEAGIFRLLEVRGPRLIPRIGVSFVRQDANEGEEEGFVAKWLPLVDVVRVSALFANGTFVNARNVPSQRTPCPVLWDSLPIHNDGRCTICCLDAEKATDMGNAADGVGEVWNGAAFTAAREAHLRGNIDATPFCLSCNGWAQAKRHTKEEFAEIAGVRALILRNPIYEYYNRVDRLENWRSALVRLGGPIEC